MNKTNTYSTILGGCWREKVVSVFLFGHSKTHFRAPEFWLSAFWNTLPKAVEAARFEAAENSQQATSFSNPMFNQVKMTFVITIAILVIREWCLSMELKAAHATFSYMKFLWKGWQAIASLKPLSLFISLFWTLSNAFWSIWKCSKWRNKKWKWF